MKDITGKLLDWETLVKKINGQAVVLNAAIENGDIPPDAVWAGEVLTDMTRDLVNRYDSLTDEMRGGDTWKE